jgi:ATP-binding cassette subfamily B protein
LQARQEFNEVEDQISGLITDNLLNFDTVKLFAKETWEYHRLSNHLKGWYTKFWHFANSFRAIDITVGTLGNVGLFLILLRTLQATSNQTITIANYIMVVGFIANFYPRFFELIWQLRRIAKNQIDMDKYLKILDQPVTVLDPVHPQRLTKSSGHINLDHVTFNYPGTTIQVLSDVNLDIAPGQSIAFVGHSGAGKTSLIKLLMRFYDVSTGSITIDGIDIRQFTKSHLRSLMGVVPQDPIMFNDTLQFNIAYGAEDPSHADLLRAVEMAHLTEFVNSLPEGFNTQVGERGIKLSGGQKQRLAIARMILSNPDIIIFDEATSQLDSESEQKIQSAFWAAASGKTTLIIAHRLSTVMRADKIIVMQDGKIIETGTHAQLTKNKKGLYNHFWKIQTEPTTSLHAHANHID